MNDRRGSGLRSGVHHRLGLLTAMPQDDDAGSSLLNDQIGRGLLDLCGGRFNRDRITDYCCRRRC